ncbi:MAG: glutaredoxin family protein [bacterium]|nr:glutaredoxin family protein [bacterium]
MSVTVYSTATCPYCKLVKEYLNEEGVEFKNVDVGEDPEAANEMVKKSGQMGVPVVEVNGEIIVGWNKAELEEALKKKKK